MKFGASLQDHLVENPDWRFHYLDYDYLKKFLKVSLTDSKTSSETWESEFVTLLERELDKVYSFQKIKTDELKRKVEWCEHTLQSTIHTQTETPQDLRIGRLEQDISRIIEEVNELSKFTRLNYTGFLKILKKHDKHTTFMLKPMFIVRLNARPFYRENFENLILRLSKLYDLVRTGGKGRGMTGNQEGGSQNFVRKTTKYWVHADNVTEVKLRVLKHLPVLIFSNKNENELEGYNPSITSIYFDNEDLDLYRGRLEKSENAEAVRLRWYGPVSNTEIFVERKTHREDWTGESSVKERFPIKEKNVNAYLAGTYTMEKTASKMRGRKLKNEESIRELEQLSSEIQSRILEKRLRPVMRSFYNRTAFQLPGDARVRISLDTELTLVREDNFDGKDRTEGNWRRKDIGIDYPFQQLEDSEVCRFPYAILEVKLQTQMGTDPPKWVRDLVESHLVEEVPKFSKFIHGCATLLEDRVRILPFWLPQMDNDIRKKPKESYAGDSPSLGAEGTHARRGEDSESSAELTKWKGKGRRVKAREYEVVDMANGHIHDEDDDDEKQPLLAEVATTAAMDTIRSTNGCITWNGTKPPNDPVVTQASSSRIPQMPNLADAGSDASPFPAIKRFLGIGTPAQRASSSSDPNALFLRAQQNSNKRIAIPVRVEPKVFFANERTFLSWLHFAIVLGGLSLGLLNFGDKVGQMSGFIFTGISMGIIMYALWTYIWRARKIRNREAGPYDDRVGPVVIVAALFAATTVNFWLKITHDAAWQGGN